MKVVSFESAGDELSAYRFTGEIIVCDDRGAKYHDLANTLPDRLRSTRSADVKEIVFVQKESYTEGTYTDGTTATAVLLKICVVDVQSGKVAAIGQFVGHSPSQITSMGETAPNGLVSANGQLYDWIVYEGTTPKPE
jgi:hypothetical protein